MTKNLDDARFIHISDYKTGDNNSVELGDGSVSLATIRSKDISTRVTILSADIETKKQMRQAHAFYNAGAINLVLSNRLIDEHVRGRFTYNFYEAINRERPPVMAISSPKDSVERQRVQWLLRSVLVGTVHLVWQSIGSSGAHWALCFCFANPQSPSTRPF